VIRVLYRWRVEPGEQSGFVAWWHDGTLAIRAAQPGAMGSTLCRSLEEPGMFVGIARWESTAHVEAFWRGAGGDGFPGARLEGVEVLDELDDLTLEAPD
jgi:heme-degrading monooxygenase HmoA